MSDLQTTVSANPAVENLEGKKKKKRKRPSEVEAPVEPQEVEGNAAPEEAPSKKRKKKKRKTDAVNDESQSTEHAEPPAGAPLSSSLPLPTTPTAQPRFLDRIINIFRPESPNSKTPQEPRAQTPLQAMDVDDAPLSSPLSSPSKRIITYGGASRARALAMQAERDVSAQVGSGSEGDEDDSTEAGPSTITLKSKKARKEKSSKQVEAEKSTKKKGKAPERAQGDAATTPTPQKGEGKPRASKTPPVPSNERADAKKARHQDMLATKWMAPAVLKKLVEQEGLEYKKGMFSQSEEDLVTKAIDDYSKMHALSDDGICAIIFAKGKGDRASTNHQDFFKHVTSAVPGRPLCSVHAYVQRKWDPKGRKGAWTDEELVELERAYARHGPQWTKIGEELDRLAADCRDRYRNYTSVQSSRRSGAWTAEEEQQLTDAVKEVSASQGKELDDTSGDVLWTAVSAKMGNVRSRAQCRVKWVDSMLPQLKFKSGLGRYIGSKQSRMWNHYHAIQMIERLISQKRSHMDDLDYSALPTPDWDIFSAHQLQRRFKHIKEKIVKEKGWDEDEVEQGLDFKNLLTAMLADQRQRADSAPSERDYFVDSGDDEPETSTRGLDPVLAGSPAHGTPPPTKTEETALEDEDSDAPYDKGPSPAQPPRKQKSLTPEEDEEKGRKSKWVKKSGEGDGLSKAERKKMKAEKKARKAEKKRLEAEAAAAA